MRMNQNDDPKQKISLLVDRDLVQKAHDLGLNISRTCELALKQRIDLIKRAENQIPFLPEVLSGKETQRCGRRDLNPGRQRGRLMS